ncbi:hypothetical protein ACWOEF_15675 [Enterococcus crotali]
MKKKNNDIKEVGSEGVASDPTVYSYLDPETKLSFSFVSGFLYEYMLLSHPF